MSHVKRVITPFQVYTAADIATSPTSVESDLTNLDYAHYDIFWTGVAPVGTITVEYLRDGAEDWETLDLGATVSISGATGSHRILLTQLPFKKLRLKTTYTSGAGTINAYLTAKEF